MKKAENTIPDSMKIRSTFIKKLSNGNYQYEVNGVVLDGESLSDIHRKYARVKSSSSASYVKPE